MRDWKECEEENIAKPIKPNTNLIKYLLESSENKQRTAELIPINETTKETIISILYDSLREILEAIAIKHGYKIYNHQCYTHFLKTKIKDETLALEFDSLRLLRNSINYYGRKIDINDVKMHMNTIKELIKKVKKHLQNI